MMRICEWASWRGVLVGVLTDRGEANVVRVGQKGVCVVWRVAAVYGGTV